MPRRAISHLLIAVILALGAAACDNTRVSCASCPTGTTISSTSTTVPGGSSTTVSTTTTIGGGPQTFTLSGTVTDDSNSSPVSGAEPEILNGPNAGKKTPSAANGTYSIPTISPGAITVRFRAGGYDTTDRDVTIGATNVTLNVAMHKTPTTTTTTTSAPALRADFGSSPNPCTMTPSGGGLSVDCTLDASSSTGAITQYSWSYLGRSDSGVRIGISADCGTGPGVQSVGVSVTLTVRDGTGATNSTTKTVTLVKKGVCGF